MTDFMNRPTVLVLNHNYFAIGTTTPQKALIAMNGLGDEGQVTKAVDVVWKKKPDGSLNLDEDCEYFQNCTFEEWLMAPIREIDKPVHTSKLTLRCPTVIITSYKKIPKKRFRPTKTILYELQGGRCGYSCKVFPFKDMNLEHKQPRSQGGKNTFPNLMAVDKRINFARGDKPLEEVGLKPLFNHAEPKPIPVSATFKNILHPDWKPFCKNT